MKTTLAKPKKARATRKAAKPAARSSARLSGFLARDASESELEFLNRIQEQLHSPVLGVICADSSKLNQTESIAEKLMDSSKHQRPTGYSCDPDSPEFTNVLMKCFADGKRKALQEAKTHAASSKRK